MSTSPDEPEVRRPVPHVVAVPTNERVVALETRMDIFLDEQFPTFRETVRVGFLELKDQIAHISPNGQTTRLIEMGKALGDPDQIASLKEMVEDHQYRRRLFRPWRSSGGTFLTAVVYSLAIAAVAAAGAFGHAILHALHLFGVT